MRRRFSTPIIAATKIGLGTVRSVRMMACGRKFSRQILSRASASVGLNRLRQRMVGGLRMGDFKRGLREEAFLGLQGRARQAAPAINGSHDSYRQLKRCPS